MSTVEVPEIPQAVAANDASGNDKPRQQQKPRLTPPEGGFTEVPPEWNKRDFAPMKKADFASPLTHLVWKIDQTEQQLRKLKEEKTLYETYGTDENSIKKARSDQNTVAKMREILESQNMPKEVLRSLLQGLDVQSLLQGTEEGN